MRKPYEFNVNVIKCFIVAMNCEESVNTFANSCYGLHFR